MPSASPDTNNAKTMRTIGIGIPLSLLAMVLSLASRHRILATGDP
jgi:hypothetical protein